MQSSDLQSLVALAIAVDEVATGSVRKLTNDRIYAALPEWSRGGQRIAFLGILGGFDYGPCL